MGRDVTGSSELSRGRELAARRAWAGARAALSEADRAEPLGAADLELLATAAYMVGRDAEWAGLMERAHHAHLADGDARRAVRCAFWLGTLLAQRGEVGAATGWLGRARRLLEHEPAATVEHGYLLLPAMLEHERAGRHAEGAAVAAEAAELGQRFGDPELLALAVHGHGQLLIRLGRIAEGLALLDEAMVAVTSEELAPIPAGLVYCGVILACQQVFELGRAQEWTAALTRWCEAQTDLVAFTGRCLVHRAELLQVRGAWDEALAEAGLAEERLSATANRPAAALAHYRRGELHRLRGAAAAAEDAYRAAAESGLDPQPGLALLRLAQGRPDAAAAAVRRAAAEAEGAHRRLGLLPALVEIMLAAGETEEARGACRELESVAAGYGSALLGAIVAQARGAVALAEGDARAALPELRRALERWEELDAPYDAARARALVGLACRALGDRDAEALELDAARAAFERLGAAAELARLEERGGGAAVPDHGLTARELAVLRLVAEGETNQQIAAALVISEHTVARHLQNIFRKLGLSSRTAAAAYAHRHDLV
jgi:DNA-binding CsgD family transcriptional regulator